MGDMDTIYLETSVVSYYTGRPSRDIITSGRQQITREWWDSEMKSSQIFISEFVTNEARRGDPEVAQRRKDALKGFEALDVVPDIHALSNEYMRATSLGEKSRVDTLHMATASYYEMDFMLSWNCKHIVNGHIIAIIDLVNQSFGLSSPIICTPESMLEDSNGR